VSGKRTGPRDRADFCRVNAITRRLVTASLQRHESGHAGRAQRRLLTAAQRQEP
jgi:hypothetical protein